MHVPGSTNKQHVILHICWYPPECCIKVNVDMSSFGNPDNRGFDGLLQNYKGCRFNIFLLLDIVVELQILLAELSAI